MPRARLSLAPFASAAALALAASCAPAPLPAPTPGAIPALERQVAARPGDTGAAARLAAAYLRAGRKDDARVLLERAVANDPRQPGAVLLLGVAYEELERFDDAQRLYERYAQVGTGRLRRTVAARRAALDVLRLRAEAKRVAAGEAGLSAEPPAPRTVAVFPFLYSGTDERLRPLGRALAEMLSTDLAQTGRLTVLERVRVQALLDEVALGQTGMVDSATAARAGRLLRAERLVQGRIGEGAADALRLEALLVSSVSGPGNSAPLAREAALARLLDAEKELALAIYAALGVELTAAERERVSRRMTENVQALLVFGLALEAQDAGDFREAAAQFRRAAELDPAFAAAVQGAEEAEAAAMATEELAAAALEEIGPPFLELAEIAALPLGRDPTSEALGSEGFDRPRTTIDIIIHRPNP
jgi:tetratricopeptide (TPR) repeat protein